ncbi:MAG: hypothetical protein HY964_02040 [Ignavibacteriales bacterium]|nr:hypothetical protein [Ignavibacteriales bacterium]
MKNILMLAMMMVIMMFLGWSCIEDDIELIPIPQLTLEDIGVTEVWLRISMSAGNDNFTLKRNDSLLATLHAPIDTVIYDEGLLPKHTYTYIAGRGTILHVTTLDTTSHDFTFTQYILGEGQNSIIRDVAIVNDSNIYVVGAMYIHDSTGAWNDTLYNVGYWNGTSWKLKSIGMPSYGFDCEYVVTSPEPLYSIFALQNGKIIISDSRNAALFSEDTIIHFPCIPRGTRTGSITKIWGISETDFYLVCTNGSIVHFQNGVWSKMESGTNTDLLDIWGTPDGSTIWACGWVDFKPTVLLRIQNNQAQKVYEDPFPFTLREDSLSGILTSVWTKNKNKLFVASHYGLYSCLSNTTGKGKRTSFAPRAFPGFPYRMRGNSEADIIIVGTYNFIGHYNGFNWKHFDELMDQNGRLRSLGVKNNLIVAVGYSYDPIHSKGLVIIGKR